MEESENEIRKKLEKSRKKILENSRKINEELDRLRLEEVKKVAKEIADILPGEISKKTFDQIVAILSKYQRKNDAAVQKLLEMESQRRVTELQNTDVNDPDWWAKASAAKLLGITIPGMEMEDVIKRNKDKTEKQDR
ncbi:MAG: hypothetical protein WC788_08445 [Candidatus Paceibacterota bacterium]|jgi:hypothetical protein